MEDTAAINIEPATLHPRATENITEIIKFVQGLIEKGYAYLKMGMFIIGHESLTTMASFLGNHLMTLKLGQVNMLVRMRLIRRKIRLILLLWKAAKPGEISWDSPWGKGRPGWHIECSVMSTKYLGKTIDIHAGGQDLEFPSP